MKPYPASALMAALLFAGANPASGAEAQIVAVPTAWRLQNYISDSVVVWYTGAPGCSSGGLHMPASASQADRERFWSLIMTAKAAGKTVFVYYETTNCNIASFGYLENG